MSDIAVALVSAGSVLAGVVAQSVATWLSARSVTEREDRLRYLEEKRHADTTLLQLLVTPYSEAQVKSPEAALWIRILAPDAVADAARAASQAWRSGSSDAAELREANLCEVRKDLGVED